MGYKKLVLAVTAGVVVLAWVALGAGLILQVDKPVHITLVLVTALATEVGFWITAAVLGIAVFEARRRVWQFIKSPFVRG